MESYFGFYLSIKWKSRMSCGSSITFTTWVGRACRGINNSMGRGTKSVSTLLVHVAL